MKDFPTDKGFWWKTLSYHIPWGNTVIGKIFTAKFYAQVFINKKIILIMVCLNSSSTMQNCIHMYTWRNTRVQSKSYTCTCLYMWKKQVNRRTLQCGNEKEHLHDETLPEKQIYMYHVNGGCSSLFQQPFLFWSMIALQHFLRAAIPLLKCDNLRSCLKKIHIVQLTTTIIFVD